MALLGVPISLAACSLWVDDTLSRKPGEGSTGGDGLGGAGGATVTGGGGATVTGGGGAGGGETCTADTAFPCCADVDCPGGKICSGNTCIAPCQGGLVACAAQCVDLATSAQHCGACGNDCLSGRTCTGGACSPPWVTMSKAFAPSPRENAAVDRAGGAVFVWGGHDGESDRADGGLYDPATDTWEVIPPGGGAPSARVLAAAVWTGTTVLVWGGGPFSGTAAFGDGARYDPESGAWYGVSGSLAPSPRRAPIAVWTGTRALLWGGEANGFPAGGGAAYDPAADSWSPIAEAGAPSARSGAAFAWSGAELYVFGGRPNGAGETNEGFAYDPLLNTWRSLPASGAPGARHGAFAAWAAGRLVVWGGESSAGALGDGAQYDPAADAWSPISSDNAPSKRSCRFPSSGWTGAAASRFLVFGGMDGNNVKKDGKVYDPLAGTWTGTGAADTGHVGGAGVWTGGELVLWSGRDGDTLDSSGERYKP